MVYFQLQP
ncbi:hypothetical protein VCHENC02_2021A, partial [Vibrio harveyi]